MAASDDKGDAGKDEPPCLDAFTKRLDEMRGQSEEDGPPKTGKAWGRAMGASSALVASLLVGALLGLGLDRWLGTTPWFLLAGIGLGFAAGLRNVMRSMKDQDG